MRIGLCSRNTPTQPQASKSHQGVFSDLSISWLVVPGENSFEQPVALFRAGVFRLGHAPSLNMTGEMVWWSQGPSLRSGFGSGLGRPLNASISTRACALAQDDR